jgi:hypothetical protein
MRAVGSQVNVVFCNEREKRVSRPHRPQGRAPVGEKSVPRGPRAGRARCGIANAEDAKFCGTVAEGHRRAVRWRSGFLSCARTTLCASSGPRSSLATPSRSRYLGQVAHELHDYPQLPLAQERLDRPDDSCMAADLQRVADLERSLATEVAGRDHLITTPHLIAIPDLTHTPCTIRESDALAARAAGGRRGRRALPQTVVWHQLCPDWATSCPNLFGLMRAAA